MVIRRNELPRGVIFVILRKRFVDVGAYFIVRRANPPYGEEINVWANDLGEAYVLDAGDFLSMD